MTTSLPVPQHLSALFAELGIDDPHLPADLADVLAAPLPEPREGVPHGSFLLGPFIRPHLAGLHPYLIEHDLPRAVDVRAVLPEGAHVLRWHRRSGWTEALAVVGRCLVVVRSWEDSAEIWISGPEDEAVTGLLAAVRARIPEPAVTTDARVGFWHLGPRGPWRSSRDLDVPPFADVEHLYPPQLVPALGRLMAYEPAEGRSGRLVLWHGEPGTGKTTAVRALIEGWRRWAAPHVVSDPEHLLSSGDYLRRLLLETDDDEDDKPDDVRRRWRLVVVEDAERLLHRGAGPALGRLLNVGDGLLGQGSKVIILLTTNEFTGDLHPALLRPGRCLARLEFPRFAPADAARLLGRNAPGAMTLAEIMEARGDLEHVEVTTPEIRRGLYL